MAEYIEREALISWLERPTGFRTNCEDCVEQDCIDCIIGEVIKNFPAADVATVVHGRWELRSEHRSHKCSVCDWSDWYAHNYCPNCGAKMDLEAGNVP